MKNILRIAWRDFTAITSTKAFWIGMAMSPLIGLGFSLMVQTIEKTQPSRHFVVIDKSDRYAQALRGAVDLQYLRTIMPILSNRYIAYKKAGDVTQENNPPIAYLSNFHGAQQTEIAKQIAAMGGTDAFINQIESLLTEQAPPLDLPPPRYQLIPLPANIALGDETETIAGLKPYLMNEQKITYQGKDVDLFAAVLVEQTDSGTKPAVAYWSKNLSDTGLSNFIRTALNRSLETEQLLANGIEPKLLQSIQSNELNLERFDISKTTNAKESMADQALRVIPFVFAGLLMILVVINIGLLLQSIIEEKSNRLLEVLLSSVSPMQLMLGKLTGVAAVTFVTIFSWLLIIASFIFFSFDASDISGNAAQAQAMAQTQLESQLDTQIDAASIDPETIAELTTVGIAIVKLIPVFLFYLVCGYLIYSSLILAIGSLCSTQQEAQSFTMPIFLFLMMPMFVAPFIVRDPNGTLATVFTWIPFFTPTVILARLQSDLPLSDLIGSTLLLLATVVLTMWISVKIFRFGALNAQQPPKFLTLVKLIFQPDK